MEVCIAFGGGIAGIASDGFSLENSRTKNSRRECRLSVPAIPVGIPVGARVSACVCMCLCACVCGTAYSGEKAIRPTKTA